MESQHVMCNVSLQHVRSQCARCVVFAGMRQDVALYAHINARVTSHGLSKFGTSIALDARINDSGERTSRQTPNENEKGSWAFKYSYTDVVPAGACMHKVPKQRILRVSYMLMLHAQNIMQTSKGF
eukprot:2451205-Amphidinium_carterae.1